MDKDTPQSAFHFRAEPAQISERKEGEPRKFSGVAYSGRALRHPFWGQVAFDVQSTKANPSVPILIEHDRGQRAGFAELSFADGQITIDKGTLLDNQYGQDVASDSDAGFPWQMSVHIEPGRLEEVQAGATAEVNGQAITGPATVFRDGFIREVSFTPTGVDHQTSAAAMSAGRHSAPHQPEQAMTIEELTAKIADLETRMSAVQAERDEAVQRAETAEQAMAAAAKDARMSAIKDLFSAVGLEFSDAAAEPYVQMDNATFSAVTDQMKNLAADSQNGHLFSDQADRQTGAGSGTGAPAAAIDTNAIYAARRDGNSNR